jgi:outer membrane protein TolC
LYPHISIIGTLGWSAAQFPDLFRSTAFNGTVGPTLQWNILNYGRLLNNVRVQDARFQELVLAYQNTVLTAQREAENGLVTFLKAHQRYDAQKLSVAAAEEAKKILEASVKEGTIAEAQTILFLQNLVQQQDTLAVAKGEIALGLIEVYRALGGGWQIRCTGCEPTAVPTQEQPSPDIETLPPPRVLPPAPQDNKNP